MASPALAVEVINTLHAVLGTSWVTGVGETLIDVALAPFPDEAWWAGAAIATHLVHTGAIVEALGASRGRVKWGMAVINIDFTVHACRVTMKTIRRWYWMYSILDSPVKQSFRNWDPEKWHSASGAHLPTRTPVPWPVLHHLGPTRQDGVSSGWILPMPPCPSLPCVPLGQEHL